MFENDHCSRNKNNKMIPTIIGTMKNRTGEENKKNTQETIKESSTLKTETIEVLIRGSDKEDEKNEDDSVLTVKLLHNQGDQKRKGA